MSAVTTEAPTTILEGEGLSTALLAYLADRHGLTNARFQEPLKQITHGWETYIYAFQLAGGELAPEWSQPLILRIYPAIEEDDRAEREAGIQRFVVGHGYPAPRPLAVETSDRYLGGQFMIMERAPGGPLLDLMVGNPVGAFGLTRRMAELHVDLHRLPVEGCPLPSGGSLIDRRLKELHRLLSQAGASVPDDAQPALDWLTDHRGVVAQEEDSVCHTDFHPLNVLVAGDGGLTVLDWSGASIGDRHSDVASTLVLLRTAPAQEERLFQRLFVRFGRRLFAWLYLRRYRQLLPLDEQRLRYWEAFRAFEWWIFSDIMLEKGSAALGLKSDTTERLPPGYVDGIRRYFWQRAS